MRITYLGQAGWMFEVTGKTGDLTVLVDPYLSNSVYAINPANNRRVPVDERFLKIRPDVIVITHDHLDHLDPETLEHYLSAPEKPVTVLVPDGGWQKLRALFPKGSNQVQFNAGSEWTEGDVHFSAQPAEHSDPHAIGVILTIEGKRYYITGDTLYSRRVLEELPKEPIEALFLPINGAGNNMNATDAARFAERVGARYTVPMHVGLFDRLVGEMLDVPNRVVPTIYQELILK